MVEGKRKSGDRVRDVVGKEFARQFNIPFVIQRFAHLYCDAADLLQVQEAIKSKDIALLKIVIERAGSRDPKLTEVVTLINNRVLISENIVPWEKLAEIFNSQNN